MSHCLDINVDMEDITWSDEVGSVETHKEPTIHMVPTNNTEPEANSNARDMNDIPNTTGQVDDATDGDNLLERNNYHHSNHLEQTQSVPSIISIPTTMKMTHHMCKTLTMENKIVILVDIQFVGDEPVEIAVCRPDYPVIFHDVYPVCRIRKHNRPINLLTGMPNIIKSNQKTIENNLRYVNMDCCQGYNGFHSRPMKNNTMFYKTLPNDAIYVLRGINKHIYWKHLLEFYNKTGHIYLFNDQFYSPSSDRRNKRPTGHFNCIHHTDKTSACSLANVYQMAMEYQHCTYMFYEYN